MFKTCECCGLLINGESRYVALYRGRLENAVPNEICNDCMQKIKKMLKYAPDSGGANSVLMKTDKTLLTKEGFVKVVRALLDGNTVNEVAEYYAVDAKIIMDAVLPVFMKIKSNPNMKTKELSELRLKQLKKDAITKFKFSDGTTRDMSNVVVMYTGEMFNVHSILLSTGMKKNQLGEFLEFYKKTAKGQAALSKSICNRLLESNNSVESVAKDLWLSVNEALESIAPILLSNHNIVPSDIRNRIIQLYQNKRNTKEIAGSIGCPYSWVLQVILEWKLPEFKDVRKVEEV